jgi:hypothetical protein
MERKDKKAMPVMGRDPRPIDADKFREIFIHDINGEDQKRPRAIIFDGWGTYVTIDILESVSISARNLSHPAIVCAVERWEKLSRAEYLIRDGNKLSRLAEVHLKNLCHALLKGIKERKVSAESAQVFSENDNLVQKEYQYLKAAWEVVGRDDFKALLKRYGSRSTKLLRFIEEKLMPNVELEVNEYKERQECEGRPFEQGEEAKQIYWDSWPVIQILEYLKSDKGHQNLARRKSWNTTKGNYKLWRFRIHKSDNARKSRQRAKERSDWLDFDLFSIENSCFFPDGRELYRLSVIKEP